MLEIVALVAPVFALIGLGFAASKIGYLEAGSARALTMFGYKVAMPALLFRAMANAGPAPVSPLRLVAAYATGIAATWATATIASRVLLRRPIADGPAIAMGASFSNGVMMGFPIILLALGPEASTPMAFLATCETMLLWFVGTIHMGLVTDGNNGLRRLGPVFIDVATNPLLIALAAGLAWHVTGWPVSPAPARLIDFLAGAAVPVALFGLGMSLAAYEIKGEIRTVTLLTVVKLALYPVLAFWLATNVYELPRVWAGALVLYVSMPVGANAFVFAARYDRAVASISGAVLITTILAVVTVTAVLAILRAKGIVVPL